MKKGYVYFIGAKAGRKIKIGYSTKPSLRIRQIQSGNPDDLEVLFSLRGTKAGEAMLHRAFADVRLKGEWFRGASTIRRVAKKLQADQVARALRAIGLDEWPVNIDLQRKATVSLGRQTLTGTHLEKALDDLIAADKAKEARAPIPARNGLNKETAE